MFYKIKKDRCVCEVSNPTNKTITTPLDLSVLSEGKKCNDNNIGLMYIELDKEIDELNEDIFIEYTYKGKTTRFSFMESINKGQFNRNAVSLHGQGLKTKDIFCNKGVLTFIVPAKTTVTVEMYPLANNKTIQDLLLELIEVNKKILEKLK